MKKAKKKKRAKHYTPKLAIKGSFGDVIGIAMRDLDIEPKKAKRRAK
jgi:hypothetical protein